MPNYGKWYLVAYFFYFALGFITNTCLRYRVKTRYKAQWACLGSPTLFNNNMQTSWLWFRFLFSRDYSRLGDPKATVLGNLALMALIILIILLIGSLFLH